MKYPWKGDIQLHGMESLGFSALQGVSGIYTEGLSKRGAKEGMHGSPEYGTTDFLWHWAHTSELRETPFYMVFCQSVSSSLCYLSHCITLP